MAYFEGLLLIFRLKTLYLHSILVKNYREKMVGIYKITSPSKRVYIGQSINIEKRFRTYKRLHCQGQILLYNSFLKYGVDKHNFEILCECEVSELNEKERFYQDLNSAIGINGLNCKLTTSSDRSGEFSLETKKKLSIATSKNRIGLKHSDETKRKMSLSLIGNKRNEGNKMSEKTRIKLEKLNFGNKYNLGKKASKEARFKMSLSKKGNKHCLGREISIITRNKISQAIKGKVKTEVHKKKLSELKIKIILNLETGVFSFGIKEASETYSINSSSLTKQLNGSLKNKTNLIYV